MRSNPGEILMSLVDINPDATREVSIMGYSYDEYVKIVRHFHGYQAPGVIIGGFMVDMAVRNLPSGVFYNTICETRSCPPDAIQLLTTCTIGNGWLTIIHSGRFAITLYDKESNKGVRVYLDAEKVKAWPEIQAWYFKLISKKEQNQERITREMLEAGGSILSAQHVQIRPRIAEKKHKGNIAVCPSCQEAYPAADGAMCLACQGDMSYVEEPGKML
jgi:formylmethanofuran dehydrogenase subunit E